MLFHLLANQPGSISAHAATTVVMSAGGCVLAMAGEPRTPGADRLWFRLERNQHADPYRGLEGQRKPLI